MSNRDYIDPSKINPDEIPNFEGDIPADYRTRMEKNLIVNGENYRIDSKRKMAITRRAMPTNP